MTTTETITGLRDDEELSLSSKNIVRSNKLFLKGLIILGMADAQEFFKQRFIKQEVQ